MTGPLVIPVLSATTQWGRLHVNVTLVSVVMALMSVLISVSAMKVSMNAQKHQNALTILVITAAIVIMDMTVKTAQVALPRVSVTLLNTMLLDIYHEFKILMSAKVK